MRLENGSDRGELTCDQPAGTRTNPQATLMPPTYLAPATDSRTARASDYRGRADCAEPNRSSSAVKKSRSMAGAPSR
ncbi:hypothetical protein GCM10009680_46030 [Streptomyces yatensis]|uniref:Uncharacterized protein n=1 Tax=Streptomyces yatensis TaxID=155177 RepID=A0ABP4U760_9ACTN